MRQRLADEEVAAGEVHVERAEPGVVTPSAGGACREGALGRDEAVERAELGDRHLDDISQLVPIGAVCGQRQRTDLVSHGVQPYCVDVGDRDLGAACDEATGRRRSDAAGATADQYVARRPTS